MIFRTVISTFLSILIFSSPVIADSDTEADKAAVSEFMKSEVVNKFHNDAYGYAVFPNIGKGGFGIGGAYGKGRVYRGGKKTGDVSMAQVSIGFQAGGQAYRQIIYFQDKRAFEDFTSGEFEFSAQAEAIAITASAGASAGTEGTSASANEKQAEASYQNGMAVFTMGKGGLMYQATLGGQKYSYTPSN
ncbi:MAG: hypothetical protein KJP10_09970 [Gammaproteobacteria bacterium]|nr:hypothetical protein [Gammaproteobacteria bacterium]